MSNTAPSAADLLAPTASVPSVKFPEPGATFTGTVISEEVQQQRDFQTGDLKFWPDGKPMWQVVLTCQDSDSEEVRLYVKGQMLTAAKAALRAADMVTFARGSSITVTFTGYGEKNTRMKVYEVSVSKPTVTDIPDEPTPAKAEAPAISEEDKAAMSPAALDALKAAGLV